MRIPGIAHRSDLPTLGISEADRRRLLRQGRITRAGTWYVTESAPGDLVALLGQGLRPTCLTAAEHHKLWVPLHAGHHVYRPRGLGHAAAPDLVPHGAEMRSWPDRSPVADLSLTLAHAARCLAVRDAAILFESALHTQQITRGAAHRLLAALPIALRSQLGRVSPLAESGTETAVRWWFESLHVPVTPQVGIPGVGRVDLMLGRSWIIECDSMRFHDNPSQYHKDRARDLRLQALGYTVTRLTWEQVFLDWEATRGLLLVILRRRGHRRPLPA